MEPIGDNIQYIIAAYGFGVFLLLGYGLSLITDRIKNLKLENAIDEILDQDQEKT